MTDSSVTMPMSDDDSMTVKLVTKRRCNKKKRKREKGLLTMISR